MRKLWLALLALLLLASSCGGGEEQPTTPDRFAYIALGDSLSAGVGASDPETLGFVALVQASFEEEVELLNLGHSGDTSQELLDHGHLDDAVAEIVDRNGDNDAGNDVRLVTLEIGGNDLLRLYFALVVTGTCPNLETATRSQECIDPLARALELFEPNLATALDRLTEADPTLRIVLLTLPNSFSGLGDPGEIGDLALDGLPDTPFPEGLNDIVRAQAEQRGLVLADVYPHFEGGAGTLISGDLIHPNDGGYQVMADVVIAALGELP